LKLVSSRFEMRQTSDSWSGRQPRYEALLIDGMGRFFLATGLPCGTLVREPLGRPGDPDDEPRRGE
jgi:hypothetical protein